MTIVLVLLGVILLIGLVMALELLRLSRATPQSLHPDKLQEEISNPAVYQPMSRLFSKQDFWFLASRKELPPGAARRLRRARWTVLSLYLRQMRHDFHRTWCLCRLLAPVSQDAEFGAMLLRQLLVFHGLYFLLRMRCVLGWYGYVEFDISNLVDVLNQLRLSAQQALLTTDALAFQTASDRG